MTSTPQLQIFFPLLAAQVPVMVVCVAACLAIIARWGEAPTSSLWGFLGFGLALVLCIAIPVVQTLAQSWLIQGHSVARSAPLFAGLSILWSVLRALSYVFLLVAIFAERARGSAESAGLERLDG